MNTSLEAAHRFSPQPFAAAHWSLPVLLAAAWVALLIGETCAPPPYYGKVAFAAATACLALWCNHLARAPLAGAGAAFALLLRSLYDLFGLALLVLLACVPLALLLPNYQCYTDRARVSEILLSATPVREAVAQRAAAAGALAGSGRDLKIGRTAMNSHTVVGGGVVTEDGVIVIVGEKPAVR